jgi:hypothetical protein
MATRSFAVGPESDEKLLEGSILEWRDRGPVEAWQAIFNLLNWWFAARGLEPDAQRVDRNHLEIRPVPWRTSATGADRDA